MISLNSTDIVARLRRFTKTVGKLSPTMPDEMRGTIAMLDLSKDPYQSEFKSFGTVAINGGVALDLSTIGLVGNAPASLILEANILVAAAGQQVKVQIQRPSQFVGVNAGAAGLNGGGQTFVNQFVQPLAAIRNENAVGGPTGAAAELITVPTTNSYIWTPPTPVVLYGAPFNGTSVTQHQGDAILFTSQTVAAALTVSIYWLEFPNIQPN